MGAVIKIIAIILCLVLALMALASVTIPPPFWLILRILCFVLAVMAILWVAGLLPKTSA